MKKISLILAFILILSFSVLMTSCAITAENGGDSAAHICADSDNNGKCDECNKDMTQDEPDEPNDQDKPQEPSEPENIAFIKDGKTEYKIVLPSSPSSAVAKFVDDMVIAFRVRGVKIETYAERDAENECEILIGEISARDEEYLFDTHTLGAEGYTVRVVGKKIIVTGGSDKAIIEALEYLESEILYLDGAPEPISELYIDKELSLTEIQDNYRIDSISVNGEEISDFTIAVDLDNPESVKAAEEIRETLYIYAGYWLKIVPIEEADRSIVIEKIERVGGEGFYVNVSGSMICFSSEFQNDIYTESTAYISRYVKVGRGDINFTDKDNFKKNIRDVYYKRFGAVGDGETDDFAAIIAAHEYANAEEGHVVYADPTGKYYIGNGHFESAIVKTDTYLGDAEFIIDDSKINKDSIKGGQYERLVPIFSINPSVKSVKASGNKIPASLTKDATNIGFAPGYNAVVLIYNSSHKNYIRVGANANSGQAEQEVVLVDKDGNIDPSTPLMWDYEQIDYYYVYYADDEPITFSGGHFTTVYNQQPSVYEPFSRGIWVYRSNVTVKDLTHRYTGEGSTGCPSGGIVIARNCYNTVVDNVEVDGPKSFTDSNAGVGMGSYEFSAKHCINITWQNCTQIDFWADEEQTRARSGGMHGTNHCRNMFYINNRLSSFDSHTGAQNITIKGCELEHINCIGRGQVLVEDTVVHGYYQKSVIILRADYGSLWMGDVTIRNVTLKVGENRSAAIMKLNWANHDFGYPTTMPTTVTVDNFTLECVYPFTNVSLCNFQGNDTSAWKFWNEIVYNPQTGEAVVNKNPYKATEKFYIKNNRGRYKFTVLPDMPTEIIDLGDD